MPRTVTASIALAFAVTLSLGCSPSGGSAPAAEGAPATAEEATAQKASATAERAPAAVKEAAAPAAGGFDAAMAAVVTPYLQIHDALAKDSVEGVAAAAEALVKAAEGLDAHSPDAKQAEHLDAIKTTLTTHGKATAAAAADLGQARTAFKAVSQGMGRWATLSKPTDLDLVYCSMTKGSWVQRPGPIRNPYHGSEMLACGEIVSGPSKAQAN